MGQEERSKEGCYAQTPWRCKSNQAWHQFQTTFSFQIEKIDRGGKLVEIVKHCAFGVPPIIIGHHLDKVMKSDFEKQICVKEGEEGLLERLSSPKWSIEETAWSIDYEHYTYIQWTQCWLKCNSNVDISTMSYAMTIEVGNQLQAWRPPSSIKRETVDREVSCLSWFWLGWWYIITSKTYKSKKPSSD